MLCTSYNYGIVKENELELLYTTQIMEKVESLPINKRFRNHQIVERKQYRDEILNGSDTKACDCVNLQSMEG